MLPRIKYKQAKMEVTWHGNSCFKVKSKTATLIINPDKDAGKLKGEVVMTSLGDNTAEVEGVERVFDWPGEYETKEIPLVGIQAWTKKQEGAPNPKEETLIFTFVIEEVRFCHLGGLGHSLVDDMVNKIGDVDVLMINAGPGSNLNEKQAVEIVESIDPKAIIAMGGGDTEAALKMLGADNIEPVEKLTLKTPSDLPNDKRLYISLTRAE